MAQNVFVATADDTRASIIRAAEQLMARHGVEGADLGEITLVAGQRNRSAIHYHFSDRNGLVQAIGVKHRSKINAVRNGRLDRLESEGDVTIKGVIDALVYPLSDGLSDPSGRDYIIIVAEECARRGSRWLLNPRRTEIDSILRVNELLLERTAGSVARRRQVVGYVLLTFPTLLADVARDVNREAVTPRQAALRVPVVTEYLTRAITPP
jgi:AcrR family transcriptional regulator